jgi:hypothetical protein
VPEATGPHNSFYRNLDVSISYPVRLARLREGMSLVPGIAFYNVANFANFNDYTNGRRSRHQSCPEGFRHFGYLVAPELRSFS